ncbi:MAG: hypothetical protein LBS70_09880 [Candidatus Accumulibacter sp.]|jgi:hypothetical protein|nr:hypothetical protein [Accumulibacter sp.]
MRNWPPERVAQLAKLYPDLPNDVVAKVMGMSVNNLAARAKKLGIEKSEIYRLFLEYRRVQNMLAARFLKAEDRRQRTEDSAPRGARLCHRETGDRRQETDLECGGLPPLAKAGACPRAPKARRLSFADKPGFISLLATANAPAAGEALPVIPIRRPHEKWSAEDKARFAEIFPRFPTEKVARMFGISVGNAGNMAGRLGLKKTPERRRAAAAESLAALPPGGKLAGDAREASDEGQAPLPSLEVRRVPGATITVHRIL